MILLYNIILLLGLILGSPVIVPLVLTSKKRRATALKRLGVGVTSGKHGHFERRDSGKQVLWVHALSVGEVVSAVPLVKAIKERFKKAEICFSASTLTGFETATDLLKADVRQLFYFPFDLIFSVRAVANSIQPDLVIVVETDIWPNFLMEMKRRRVPVLLVNARLSEESFKGYRRLFHFFENVLSGFSKICAQSEQDAQRFISLGVKKRDIAVTGSVKFDQVYESDTREDIERLRRQLRILPEQKVFLAGSTHEGEEKILIDVFRQIKKRPEECRFIVVPRNPERALPVRKLFEEAGFTVRLFNKFVVRDTEIDYDVLIVDVIGVLRKLYTLADIAFVGGSLVPSGGHNPIEPAAFSKPILFGPDMSDFEDISRMLLDSGGAISVRNTKGLYEAAAELLSDKKKAHEMGSSAFNVLNANKGALERTLNIVLRYLKET